MKKPILTKLSLIGDVFCSTGLMEKAPSSSGLCLVVGSDDAGSGGGMVVGSNGAGSGSGMVVGSDGAGSGSGMGMGGCGWWLWFFYR